MAKVTRFPGTPSEIPAVILPHGSLEVWLKGLIQAVVVETLRRVQPTVVTAHGDDLLSPAEAGALLHVSPKTLAQWRVRGGGPEYVKAGRSVSYRRADLLEWQFAQRRAHTGEVPR